MSAMDLQSPMIPTWDATGGYDGNIVPYQAPDPYTSTLRDALNAQVTYVPTMLPPTFPVYVRAQDNGPGDSIYSPDGVYSQPYDYMFTSRWGASNYDPMIQPVVTRYESPEMPYTHLSYNELILDSTISMNQGAPGGQLSVSLRAPYQNEGMVP
jgi:hypothetical protein